MTKTTFQGLTVTIENPAGSVRKGKGWQVTMPWDYGFVNKTEGVDGDEVDCFIGPNEHAKWAYIVHQLNKNTGEWDEDKVFLGFDSLPDAKDAYWKAYDVPSQFFGSIEAVKMSDLKEKLKQSKSNPQMIHASKMNKAIALYSGSENVTHEPITVGSEVTMDGMTSYRGIVKSIKGDRVTVKFRNGVEITKDIMFVHNIADRTKKMWSDKMNAAEQGEELEGSPIRTPATSQKWIEKVGTQWCVRTNGVDKNLGCWPSKEKAEAVMAGKSFIEPDLLAGKKKMRAGGPGSGPKKHSWKNPYPADEEGREPSATDWGTLPSGVERHEWRDPQKLNAGGPGSGRRADTEEEYPVAYLEKHRAPHEDIKAKKKKIKAAMPQTGWQYGKRTLPVGYLPQRTLSGFPSGKGGGRGGLPKVPMHGTPKPSAKPKMGLGHRLPNPAGHAGAGHRTPNPVGKIGHGVRFTNPPMQKAKEIFRMPRPNLKPLEAFADLGEPMAGALQHAHLDSNMFFHPPSLLKRNKETHVPTDDPGETNNRFLDVDKRKEAEKDRMKLLKRSSPGNTLIPVHTTLLSPHQGSLGSSQNLMASTHRRRRVRGGMFRAFNAAKI